MSIKKPGWEQRLTVYLSEAAHQSFKPGVLDCAFFFADGVRAMTGYDLARGYRGKYRSLAKGRKIMVDAGFADHVEFVAAKLTELPSPLMAQRGDGVAVRDINDEPALGIVQGEKIYCMTMQGLTLVPLTEAYRAFRV